MPSYLVHQEFPELKKSAEGETKVVPTNDFRGQTIPMTQNAKTPHAPLDKGGN